MRTFIETLVFTERLPDYMGDKAFSRLQDELGANPQKGSVMPGCGGLRKVRAADERRGKGKRGGARVIYLDVPEAECIAFFTIYGKDEQDDLTADQKRFWERAAKAAKADVMAIARKAKRNQR